MCLHRRLCVEENPNVELNEIVYPPLCNGDAVTQVSLLIFQEEQVH